MSSHFNFPTSMNAFINFAFIAPHNQQTYIIRLGSCLIFYTRAQTGDVTFSHLNNVLFSNKT